MYRLTLDLPNLAHGAEVELDGLGIFKNGESHDISTEEDETFRRQHPISQPVFDTDNNIVGAHLIDGPSVLDAFKNNRGITVEIVKGEDESGLDIAKALNSGAVGASEEGAAK